MYDTEYSSRPKYGPFSIDCLVRLSNVLAICRRCVTLYMLTTACILLWNIFLEVSQGYIFRGDHAGGITTVPMTVCLPVCHKCRSAHYWTWYGRCRRAYSDVLYGFNCYGTGFTNYVILISLAIELKVSTEINFWELYPKASRCVFVGGGD